MSAPEAVAALYWRSAGAVLLAGTIWSLTGLAIRAIAFAGAWQILFFRSLALVLVLAAVIAAKDRRRPLAAFRRAGWPGIAGGLALVAAFSGAVIALQTTTVANAMFLFAAAPMIAALLGRIVVGERVRPATAATMLLAVAGVLVMVADGVAAGRWFGNLMALMSASGFAVFTVALRFGRSEDMLPAVAIGGAATLIVATSVSLLAGAGLAVTPGDAALSLGMGVGLAIGLILYTHGSRQLAAAELTLLAMTEVLLGPVWVWLAFAEAPTPAMAAGGLVLLAAVAANALLGADRTARGTTSPS